MAVDTAMCTEVCSRVCRPTSEAMRLGSFSDVFVPCACGAPVVFLRPQFNGTAWLFLGVPTSSSLLYREVRVVPYEVTSRTVRLSNSPRHSVPLPCSVLTRQRNKHTVSHGSSSSPVQSPKRAVFPGSSAGHTVKCIMLWKCIQSASTVQCPDHAVPQACSVPRTQCRAHYEVHHVR